MKRILRIFRGNDIILSIYLSFVFLLALTVVLIGVIFLHLYERNYLDSYTETLTGQSRVIARRVGNLARNGRVDRFMKYSVDIDEIQRVDETDVWIVSNEKGEYSLSDDFTNADTDSLTEEMYQVLNEAFEGRTASSSNFDKVYGMMILRVATPVYADKERTQVCGAVMLVSMLARRDMGVRQGGYLITLSALFALFVSYIVAIAFSKYLSQPLNKIGQDIMRLAEGDYSERNIRHKRTQLGRLRMALAELAGRLRQINEEREALDRSRQDFFANISHELRTPITVIRGYSETLADGVITGKEQVAEYHSRIVQECQGMERLVGDLFILSKMQNPDFQMEKEPVSLVQIFSDVVRSGKVLGEEKGIVFETKFPEDVPCLMLGDYGRLRQMFLVIVDNAVKFSEEGGTIEIVIERREQSRLFVSIRDYGVGISEEQLPLIFEKFYTSKLRQNENGTGLGLMIAKQIALRHDGDISVESKPGEGTVFYFEFAECSIEEAEMM